MRRNFGAFVICIEPLSAIYTLCYKITEKTYSQFYQFCLTVIQSNYETKGQNHIQYRDFKPLFFIGLL